MPTQRGNGRYYTKRIIPGFGKVRRSLRTERKNVARRREEALLALAEQGRQKVVRAWLDGNLKLVEIVEAWETGSVHELARTVRNGNALLGEAADAALRDKSPDVADSTLERYTTGLGHFRSFAGEDARLRDALTTDTVQAFKKHRLDEDEVAEETVNNDLTAVEVLCTYAEREGLLEERPEIRKFSTKVRISYLDSGEIASYMAELRPAFRPVMQLLLGTGMRLGEAEGLRVSDLRLGNGEARAMVGEGKTDESVRAVFIPEWVVDTLDAHLRETGRSERERVLQIPRRTTQKEHNRARGKIGRPEYTVHDHRHTAAVHLARAGMPLHLLQRQLGHSNVEQTMRYARFHPEYGDVGKYFERVGRELGMSPNSGHSLGHTPSREAEEGRERETA